jgi:hypothetical protein
MWFAKLEGKVFTVRNVFFNALQKVKGVGIYFHPSPAGRSAKNEPSSSAK